jgi:anti-sigma factor RsiW
MRCERSQRLLGRELDGRLEGREAARLAAHLAGCAPCAAARTSLARAWERLGALPSGPPASEDWPAISARIAQRVERRPWLLWPLVARRVVGAGAIAGLAVLGLLVGDAAAHAALRPGRAASLEAVAIAEGFGDLPFGAPSPGLLLAGNGALR